MARIIVDEIAYRSTDLYFSAFVVAQGTPIQDVIREGRRCSFEFAPLTPDLWNALRSAWFDGTATVLARRYSETIRDLKGLVHERL